MKVEELTRVHSLEARLKATTHPNLMYIFMNSFAMFAFIMSS
jgi:hypothetical protein